MIVSNTTGSATGSGDVLILQRSSRRRWHHRGQRNLGQSEFSVSPRFSAQEPNPLDIGTLTIGKKLILGSNSEYLCLVDGDTGESDLVVANSVSIDPTAMLDLSENGTAPVGMTFTIIESSGQHADHRHFHEFARRRDHYRR